MADYYDYLGGLGDGYQSALPTATSLSPLDAASATPDYQALMKVLHPGFTGALPTSMLDPSSADLQITSAATGTFPQEVVDAAIARINSRASAQQDQITPGSMNDPNWQAFYKNIYKDSNSKAVRAVDPYQYSNLNDYNTAVQQAMIGDQKSFPGMQMDPVSGQLYGGTYGGGMLNGRWTSPLYSDQTPMGGDRSSFSIGPNEYVRVLGKDGSVLYSGRAGDNPALTGYDAMSAVNGLKGNSGNLVDYQIQTSTNGNDWNTQVQGTSGGILKNLVTGLKTFGPAMAGVLALPALLGEAGAAGAGSSVLGGGAGGGLGGLGGIGGGGLGGALGALGPAGEIVVEGGHGISALQALAGLGVLGGSAALLASGASGASGGLSQAANGATGSTNGVAPPSDTITVTGNPLPAVDPTAAVATGLGTAGTIAGVGASAANPITVTGNPTPPPDAGAVVAGAAIPIAGATTLGTGAGSTAAAGGTSTLDKISSYLGSAGLITGALGNLLGGGSGSGSTTVAPTGLAGDAALNSTFHASLPTSGTLPGGGSTRSPRVMPQQDWNQYAFGPEQSFFTNVPQPGTVPGASSVASLAAQQAASGGSTWPNVDNSFWGWPPPQQQLAPQSQQQLQPQGGLARGGQTKDMQPLDYVQGPGDGRDDRVLAGLSDGEYVMDAESVALLGNGSNKAGAQRLDEMRRSIRKHKGKSMAKGNFSVKAKAPEAYLGGLK